LQPVQGDKVLLTDPSASSQDDNSVKNLLFIISAPKYFCKTFGINLPENNINPDLNLHNEYEVDVYAGVRK